MITRIKLFVNFKSASSKSANFRVCSVIMFTNMKLFAIPKEQIFDFVVITCNKHEVIFDFQKCKFQKKKKKKKEEKKTTTNFRVCSDII